MKVSRLLAGALAAAAVTAAQAQSSPIFFSGGGTNNTDTNWFTFTTSSGVVDGSTFQVTGDVTSVTLDGIAYNSNPSGTLFSIGPINFTGTSHVVRVTGTGTYTYDAELSYGGGSTTASPGVIAAVPEPESYALFLAGLGALGFIARRRSS